MAERGGIVVDTGQEHRFLPADVALAVVPAALVVPVPGLAAPAVGVTLTDDRVATVVRIGSLATQHMVMCEIDGGSIALAGVRVVASGAFPSCGDGGGVVCDGRVAKELDVRALTREVEAAIWRTSGTGHNERHR